MKRASLECEPSPRLWQSQARVVPGATGHDSGIPEGHVREIDRYNRAMGHERDAAPRPVRRDAASESYEPSSPYAPGEFVLGGSESSVAVCTLASQSLLTLLAGRPEIAIAGRVYTENVGIEKMVQNLLANPRLRYLLLCGRESRHRVGQAILSLHRNGVDSVTRRIRGATAPEPVLANLSAEAVVEFQRRFEVVDLIGEQDPERILERARAGLGPRSPAEPGGAAMEPPSPETPKVIRAEADPASAWTYDPRGFFLIQVDRPRRLLLLEHYD